MSRAESFLDQLEHDRGLWFLIYFAVVVAYLLLNQGGSIDLDRFPIWAFRAFAFGGLIVFTILDSKRIRDAISHVNLLGVLPIALLVMLVVSNVVSIRPFETVEETMNILSYAILALLCYTYIDNLSRLRQFIEIILVLGFLIAIHGLFIFYGALWSDKGTTPLSSLFYWHNPCAGFLLLIWPVMLAQFYSFRRGWQTFLILYLFYFTFTAFGLTLSRGGWIAGFVPFLFIPFFLSRKKLMVSWRPIILVVLYFFSAMPFIMKYRGRFLQPIVDRWNQLRLDDYSVVGRFEFWDIGWRVFLKHPIFGIGFNTFGYYYVHYQTNPQYYTKDPHNIYLQFLLEGGIFGGAVIISILLIVAKLIYRSLTAGPGKMLTVYRIGLLGGIVASLLHNGIDFDWTFPVIPLLLVCQIAVVQRTFIYPKGEQELPITHWEPESEAVVPESSGAKKTGRRGIFLKSPAIWLTLSAILFTANILGYVSMLLYEKGQDLIDNQGALASQQAESQMGQLQREAVRGATQEIPSIEQLHAEARSGIIMEAVKLWKESLYFNPWNWYPLKELVAAHFYWAHDAIDAELDIDLDRVLVPGLDYSERLLRVTPYRPASYYYVGQLRIIAGRYRDDPALAEMGLQNMLHSIELDPINIPQYYLGIAQYYYETGDNDKALEYLLELVRIFVPKNDDGSVDFGALRGKSLARHDWVDITETCREAWRLMAEIYYGRGEMDKALEALYNGFNTPLGGGEALERYQNLKLLQLPFEIRISEIAAEQGDWTTVFIRARDAIDTMNKNDMLGTSESRHIYDLFYLAQAHLDESEEEQGTGNNGVTENSDGR
jgi:O-antigen ligase/tetratricopeptide (TPR) repeat protein